MGDSTRKSGTKDDTPTTFPCSSQVTSCLRDAIPPVHRVVSLDGSAKVFIVML